MKVCTPRYADNQSESKIPVVAESITCNSCQTVCLWAEHVRMRQGQSWTEFWQDAVRFGI